MKTLQISNEFDSECNAMPEIFKIEFDCLTTNDLLTVNLISLETERKAKVEFRSIESFRVLDEGDLMNYWDEKTRSKGWLWEIIDNGWLESEIKRDSAFSSKSFFSDVKEYLVCGSGKCLNIICYEKPKSYNLIKT